MPRYAPSAGIVRFDGRELSGLAVHERARLGIALAWQEPARLEGLPVHRYLALLDEPAAGIDMPSLEEIERLIVTGILQ